jgi:hypothetical protein
MMSSLLTFVSSEVAGKFMSNGFATLMRGKSLTYREPPSFSQGLRPNGRKPAS